MFIQLLLLSSPSRLYALPIDPTEPHDDTCTGSSDNLRTTYGIVSSCLLTILSCVWGAVHPNIPGPYDAGWTILKRRMTATFCTLLAPELMVMWALRQRYAAKFIQEKYNKDFGIQGGLTLDQSDWRGIVRECLVSARKAIHEWFTKLPNQAAVRRKPWTIPVGNREPWTIPVGNREPWTITHGHFVQMGGFMLYEGENPRKVLEFDYMWYLIQRGQVDSPAVTEAELKDRSKGNALSKGIVLLQTSWFVVQCLARLASRLPLTELEVVTLAFAVMNGVVYWAWWDKPQGVDIAIPIHLRFYDGHMSDSTEAVAGHDADIPAASGLSSLETGSALAPISGTDGQANEPTQLLNNTREDIRAQDTSSLQTLPFGESFNMCRGTTESPPLGDLQGKTASSISGILLATTRSTVRAFHALPWPGLPDNLRHKLKSFSKKIFSVILYTFYQLGDMLWEIQIPDGAMTVPDFYSYKGNQSVDASLHSLEITAFCIGALFGAVHFFAWASVFPSPAEQIVWRVSVLTTTAGPLLLLLAVFISEKSWLGDNSQEFADVLFIVTAIFYVLCRIALLTVAVLSLRDLQKDVFVQISWTTFIPHF